MKIVGMLLGLFAACILLLLMLEQLLRLRARRRYCRRGMQVRVPGCRSVNLWREGEGKQTVVLLSGWATPCPALDFAPLIDALKQKATVVAVESPGYGGSADCTRSRTVDNLVEEFRCALKGAGLEPPYILAPHSMSGFAALRWIQRYPAEVAGLAALDTSVPLQVENAKVRGNRRLRVRDRLSNLLGLTRLRCCRGKYDARLVQYCGGNPGLLAQVRALAGGCNMDRAVSGELRRFTENARTAQQARIPAELPAMMFVSTEMIERTRTLDYDWLGGHRDQMKGVERARLLVLESSHYVHHEKAAEIAAEMTEFFDLDNSCASHI